MKVAGNDRRFVQKTLERTFHAKTGLKFKWERGEKPRIVKAFATLCKFMGNKNDFQTGLQHFEAYVKQQVGAWLTWSKRSRSNLLGFISNQKAMQDFAIKHLDYSAQESKMSGVNDTEKWDDF